MSTLYRTTTRLAVLFGVAVALSIMPLFVHAQTSASSSADLRAAIQSAVLKDPSSANIPPAQLNALIDALTQKAQAQGVTAQQINYRPGQPVAGPAIVTHATCQTAFCTVAGAFGFTGPLATLLFICMIIAGILILIVGALLLRHHRMHSLHQQSQPPLAS